MAGCQERSIMKRCFLLLVCFIPVVVSKIGNFDTVLHEFPTHVLQRHIKLSRHQPFCVVFRHAGLGSKLERIAYSLWKKEKGSANYTNWSFGAFSPLESKMPINNPAPDRLPAFRCYLGETSRYDYNGKTAKLSLKEWLATLDALFAEQSIEVTETFLRRTQSQFRVILLAFPDGPRHHEVEDLVYGLASEMDSSKALAVHLNSEHCKSLREMYGVTKYPSVVVIHNAAMNISEDLQEEYQVFSGHGVNKHVLRVYLEAHSLVPPFLTKASFEDMLFRHEGADWRFQPVLVCFYAHWGVDVHGYLSAFNVTVEEYQRSGVNMRYGLMDLTLDSTKKVVKRHLSSGAMRSVPFLALYYRDTTGNITHSVIHVGRPYPWVLFEPVENIGQGVLDLTGIEEYAVPWGHVSYQQSSSLLEGPYGSLCTTWASNLTDSTPIVRKPIVKKRKIIRKPVTPEEPAPKSWHQVFDSDNLEKQLTRHNGIPLVTADTWTDIIEKSHAPRHIFYQSGQWAGEVTKASLVVFIMADCGSCRRNNKTFHDLQEAVSHTDGGAMYHINCTAEPLLCRHHNVRGFPTISTFRGLGWMDTGSCVSDRSHGLFKRYVRLDYYGIITTSAVMEWFSKASGNAVTNLEFNQPPVHFQDKDVHLVAELMPVEENNNQTDKDVTASRYMSYRCMRLLCERLYSVADCYSVYKDTVAGTDVRTDGMQLAVTQITSMRAECTSNSPFLIRIGDEILKIKFARRDGIQAVMMRKGQSLQDTLEDQSNTELHQFHTGHSYPVEAGQTCEDDVAVCTDTLTEFVMDHSRLPVTPLTSDMFHTASSFLKEDDLPIMVALVHPDNVTQSATFIQELTAVAYEMYSVVKVMTVDTQKYSVWATNFVPAFYGHSRVFESDDPDPLLMYQYPRLCIVKKDDHRHAALYPHPSTSRQGRQLTRETMLMFVQSYLEDPDSWIVETEHF